MNHLTEQLTTSFRTKTLTVHEACSFFLTNSPKPIKTEVCSRHKEASQNNIDNKKARDKTNKSKRVSEV